MLSVTEIMLLRFYTDFRKIKIISSLNLSILTLMNIHIVHLPVFNIANTHVRTSKSQIAIHWFVNTETVLDVITVK